MGAGGAHCPFLLLSAQILLLHKSPASAEVPQHPSPISSIGREVSGFRCSHWSYITLECGKWGWLE